MSQKVAYVTGGMGGIGTAICQRLHQDGFVVIAGCGPTRDFNKWLDEQKAMGFNFYASVGNVSSWESTVDAFAKAKAEHGPIDVLVNNAGIQHVATIEKFPVEKWDAIIAINLTSAFHTSRLAIPHMQQKNWGRIINVASVHGLVASAQKSAYVAAKHGLVGLTKVTALENATTGVTCNAICPGTVETPSLHDRINAEADPVQARKNFIARQPMGRLAQAHEIAPIIVFLASDEAIFATGNAYMVDGGMTI